MKLDLHVHTTVSDGRFTPEGVLELALDRGLKILAITDHDAIDAFDMAGARLEEKRKAARADEGWAGPQIRLLAGVEFSTHFEKDEVHILGYFPGEPPAELRAFLRDAEERRRERIAFACVILTRLGYPISFEEVMALAPPGRSLGRPHLARALVEKGIAVSVADAFRRFLATERGVVPQSHHPSEEVVRKIREWGGTAAIAHPLVERADALVTALLPCGLEGLELYGKKTRRGVDQLYLETLAQERGLYGTAGSDWHGKTGPDLEGVSIGVDKIGAFLERVGVRAS